MSAFLPLGIIFIAIGTTIGASQGFDKGIAFLVIGTTFLILSFVNRSEDSSDDDDGDNGDESDSDPDASDS